MEKANFSAKKQLLSINQTSEVFGIGRHKLRELVRSDPTIPTIQIGSFTKIHAELFAEWLEKAVLQGRSL